MPSAFTLLRPKIQTAPVVFASPHSGCFYPQEFIKSVSLDALTLRHSEDAFVDELYEGVIMQGAPLLKANFPRAYVDLNREAFELSADMFDGPLPTYVNFNSERAAVGLGTVAKIVTNGVDIYSHKLDFAEVRQRIDNIYYPYHQALEKLIAQTCDLFGGCILIDCHSMPSLKNTKGIDPQLLRTDIVLGDRFGSSCAEWLSNLAHDSLEQEGFVVRRNKPYAGGYTTQHYSDMGARVHTLQIELHRGLYMDEEKITRLEALDDIKHRLKPLIERLCKIDPKRL